MACELSVRIVPGDARCLQYRRSANDSCRGCVEFAAAVVESVDAGIKPVDVESMPVDDKPKQLRKGDKFHCPECGRDNATYESGGLCGVCNAKRRKAKRLTVEAAKPAKSGPVVKPAAVYPDLKEAASSLPDSFGTVQNAAGDAVLFGVSSRVLDAIQCLLEGVERRLLVDVSGMPDDEAIIHVARVVQSMAAGAKL